MAKIEHALNHLRAVGALVTLTGEVETVADVHQLAAMTGATVQRRWLVGGRVMEWYQLIIDGAIVVVQAARPAVPSDFDALDPAVRA